MTAPHNRPIFRRYRSSDPAPMPESAHRLDLAHRLDALPRPRLLVLGDLILDRYTWGNAERVSQEAPVVVLQADDQEVRPGGAANVCLLLRGLEAHVTCCGVLGGDADGAQLRELLASAGIGPEGVIVDVNRPTTVKHRFVGRAAGRHPHQIVRVDHESRAPLPPALEEQLIAWLVAEAPRHSAVLVSDYGKGACSPRIVAAAIAACRRAGVPVLVDPARGADWSLYEGATLLKANRAESEAAAGRKILSAADAAEAGRALCHRLDLSAAIITLDRDGMVLIEPPHAPRAIPTRARAVYDITGAGDMVLAMLGLAVAGGLPLDDAARLANVAAGLEVERFGVSVVHRDELRRELARGAHPTATKRLPRADLAQEIAARRARGERIVFTNGCFDLLHVGHVTYLEQAAALGDVLIVGVNSDASVRRLKGPQRPVIDETDRAAMLAALACVDYVTVFDEDTPHALLHALRPDVLVKGGTYTREQVVGHEVVEAYGGEVHVVGVVDGVSTTRILESISAQRGPIPVPHFLKWSHASSVPWGHWGRAHEAEVVD